MFIKNHNAVGYTLLEMLLYITCMSIMSILMYTWYASWHMSIQNMQQRLNRVLPIYLAYDMMKRDLYAATQEMVSYDTHQLMIRYPEQHITWLVKDEKLLRLSKNFHHHEQRWLKQTTSLIAQHIKALYITQQEELFHISIQHAYLSKPSQCVIGLYAGRYI